VLDRELVVGQALIDNGAILRIGSVPEPQWSVGLLSGGNRDHVNRPVGSLPMRRWFDVNVVPLSARYLEAHRQQT